MSHPPAPGAEPLDIVQGYLRATSNYQPNFSVAKQFLTKSAAQSWSPEDGATIYTGTLTAVHNDVVLDATVIGTLGADRSYTARDRKDRFDFGLVQENGEWRISKPPAGLMVEQYSFASFYQPYNLYFVGNGSVLVPDPIYLPSFRSQSSTTSVLMKGLLAGPSSWLEPAVISAIPAGTALSVDAVTVSAGVADVALSDQVLALNDAQRNLMAAQVVYTLKQVPGVQSRRVRGQPAADADAGQRSDRLLGRRRLAQSRRQPDPLHRRRAAVRGPRGRRTTVRTGRHRRRGEHRRCRVRWARGGSRSPSWRSRPPTPISPR